MQPVFVKDTPNLPADRYHVAAVDSNCGRLQSRCRNHASGGDRVVRIENKNGCITKHLGVGAKRAELVGKRHYP